MMGDESAVSAMCDPAARSVAGWEGGKVCRRVCFRASRMVWWLKIRDPEIRVGSGIGLSTARAKGAGKLVSAIGRIDAWGKIQHDLPCEDDEIDRE
jgi:hypothetical protein